ncbi:hypothetical protein PRIPAC_81669, partial [Pristionchus pacificus]
SALHSVMPGQCAALAAMRDLDDIYEHMSQFCMECIEVQLEEAANGEELIFTDGPPSWIAEQQAREAEERAEKERQAVMAKKRAALEKRNEGKEKKINWASAEDEKKATIRKMAGEFADRHLEYEIRKLMGVDDSVAAQMRLDLKRELANERKEKEKAKERVEVKEQIKQQKEELRKNPDGPREKNKFQNRPWQPQILRAVGICDERRSVLSAEEQKRYVAILSNFHKTDQAMRFSQNSMDLKVYDDRLTEERAIVNEIVREHFKDTTISMQEINQEVNTVLLRWSARYLHDQRRFERLKALTWKRESEKPPVPGVLKPNLEYVLMAAPNPKLVLPATMHDRLPVNYTPYRFDPSGKRREDIGRDTALTSLLDDVGCTIAMECTTAVHLMGRPGEPRNYAYHIPVTVREQFRGGTPTRLIFLDKPRPQSGITNHTLLHMVAKYRGKSTFTKPEDPHSKPGGPSRDTVAPKTDTVVMKKEEGGGGGGSLLDNLLGNLIAPASSSKAASGGSTAKPSTTSHSYGLFTIPSYTQPETKVIIRSSPCVRNDATGGTEYALATKVEMTPEAGVMHETFEEMLWTSMKTLFKGAVNSATVHMHPYMKDALQITQARAIPPGTHYNAPFFPLLSTRTEHLSQLLAELKTLEGGEYLLQVLTAQQRAHDLQS